MWALINETPFAAERAFARDREGAEVWLVVVKGTFTVTPDGSTEIAAKQEPVLHAPVYVGEPGKSSLRYEADLVLTKPTTDVLLHGHAYAPNNRPAPEVTVTLSVDSLTKTLRVVGDRTWTDGWRRPKLSEPIPFGKMPLVYERAYGGEDIHQSTRDKRNPVGKGFFVKPEELPETAAPNIDYPDASDSATGDKRRPAGFGPIARDWSPRLELAGTYDAAWSEHRKPLVPVDFDDRFYQAAPADQQAPRYLSGGEDVELVNLTPSGRLHFHLPRVAIGCETTIRRKHEWGRPDLHTVVIEPDLNRVILVWHTALPCHFTAYDLQRTRVYLKRRLESVRPTNRKSAAAGETTRRRAE